MSGDMSGEIKVWDFANSFANVLSGKVNQQNNQQQQTPTMINSLCVFERNGSVMVAASDYTAQITLTTPTAQGVKCATFGAHKDLKSIIVKIFYLPDNG